MGARHWEDSDCGTAAPQNPYRGGASAPHEADAYAWLPTLSSIPWPRAWRPTHGLASTVEARPPRVIRRASRHSRLRTQRPSKEVYAYAFSPRALRPTALGCIAACSLFPGPPLTEEHIWDPQARACQLPVRSHAGRPDPSRPLAAPYHIAR